MRLAPFSSLDFLLLQDSAYLVEIARDYRETYVAFETANSVVGATVQPALLQRVDRRLHRRVLPARFHELLRAFYFTGGRRQPSFSRKHDLVEKLSKPLLFVGAMEPLVEDASGEVLEPALHFLYDGWAAFLQHMWNMHGVDSIQRWFIRATDKSLYNRALRFLVKNCEFNAEGTRAGSAYTHEGAISKMEVKKQNGIPGHGQDNPQFDFGDHVVVKYGGNLYDPSYGVGPYANDALYLEAALCGLGKGPSIPFFTKDKKQQIPTECVPYDKGFSEYTIVLNPLDIVAKSYRTNGAALMPYCVFFDSTGSVRKYPKDKSEVTTGMWALVRTTTGFESWQMGKTMTLGDIALRHSKTEDEIFNHAKNAAVKLLRGNKGGLETGDTIVVPKDLDPNCWLVFGHDI